MAQTSFKAILSTYRQLAPRLAELLNRVCNGRWRKDLAQQVELALHGLLVSHQLISTQLQVLDKRGQFKVLVLICDTCQGLAQIISGMCHRSSMCHRDWRAGVPGIGSYQTMFHISVDRTTRGKPHGFLHSQTSIQ